MSSEHVFAVGPCSVLPVGSSLSSTSWKSLSSTWAIGLASRDEWNRPSVYARLSVWQKHEKSTLPWMPGVISKGDSHRGRRCCTDILTRRSCCSDRCRDRNIHLRLASAFTIASTINPTSAWHDARESAVEEKPRRVRSNRIRSIEDVLK